MIKWLRGTCKCIVTWYCFSGVILLQNETSFSGLFNQQTYNRSEFNVQPNQCIFRDFANFPSFHAWDRKINQIKLYFLLRWHKQSLYAFSSSWSAAQRNCLKWLVGKRLIIDEPWLMYVLVSYTQCWLYYNFFSLVLFWHNFKSQSSDILAERLIDWLMRKPRDYEWLPSAHKLTNCMKMFFFSPPVWFTNENIEIHKINYIWNFQCHTNIHPISIAIQSLIYPELGLNVLISFQINSQNLFMAFFSLLIALAGCNVLVYCFITRVSFAIFVYFLAQC